MKAFSTVPPINEQPFQKFQLQIPVGPKISIEAINQTNKQKKFHLISYPNNILSSKINNHLQSQVENEAQNQIHRAKELLGDEKPRKKLQIFQLENKKEQKREPSFWGCQEVQKEQDQEIALSQKLKIKKFTSQTEGQGTLPLQSQNKKSSNQDKNELQFKQLSHIIFSPSQQNGSFIIHKKPIFDKKLPNNSINQQNLIQSFFKNTQKQLRKKDRINLDDFVYQNEQIVESHIQCNLFGKSKIVNNQNDLTQIKTKFTKQKEQKISQLPIRQKSQSIFSEAERETFDQQLYDSYHRNKNKIKFLGRKKTSIIIDSQNTNLQSIKLHITKMINIKPSIF